MIVCLKTPFPNNSTIVESYELANDRLIFCIPDYALIASGQINVEISFQHAYKEIYYTLPDKVKINVAESFVPADGITGLHTRKTVSGLLKEVDDSVENAKEKINNDGLLIIEKMKDNLKEYSEVLKLEQDNVKANNIAEIYRNLYELEERSKNMLNAFEYNINAKAVNAVEKIDLKSNEIFDKHKNNFFAFSNESMNNLIKKAGLNELADDESIISKITYLLNEMIDKKLHKVSLDLEELFGKISNTTYSCELAMDNYKVSIPKSFKLTDSTKVYANGLFCLNGTDYVIHKDTQTIIFKKIFDTRQTIVCVNSIFNETQQELIISNSNMPNSIITRDENGNFEANVIIGSLKGNSDTATKLKQTIKINNIALDENNEIFLETKDLTESANRRFVTKAEKEKIKKMYTNEEIKGMIEREVKKNIEESNKAIMDEFFKEVEEESPMAKKPSHIEEEVHTKDTTKYEVTLYNNETSIDNDNTKYIEKNLAEENF